VEPAALSFYAECRAVELFSLWPLWLIFWRQAASPFEVVFTAQPGATEPHAWREPLASRHPKGTGKGDGMRWFTLVAYFGKLFVLSVAAALVSWRGCHFHTLTHSRCH